MLQFALAIVLAAASSLWWPGVPPNAWSVPLLIAALWALSRPWPAIAGCALGLAITILQLNGHLSHQVSPDLNGRDLITDARIISLPQASRWGWQFEAQVESDQGWQGRLQIHWSGIRRPPQPGERWRFCLHLKPPVGWANPVGMDRRQLLVARGIHGTASVGRCLSPQRLAGEPNLRARLAKTLARLAPRQADLLATLALGDRGQLVAESQSLFQRTGTAHLLAISGLHVVMLFAGVLLLTGGSRGHRPWRWLMALVCAGFYVWLAGAAVSAQRALLMLLLVVIFRGSGLRMSGPELLAVVAGLVVVVDVRVVYGAGFWLSFTAVAAILAATRLWPAWRRWPRWRQLLAMQLWLSLTSALFAILLFGTASLVAPLANLLAIPLVTWLLLPLALLAMVALMVGADSVAAVLINAAGWVGEGLVMLLRLLDERLLSAVAVNWHLQQWWLVVAALAVAIVGRRWLRWFAFATLGGLLLPALDQPAADGWRMTLLDVGQALMVVVESGGQVMVYDVGDESRPGMSAAARVLVPLLDERGYNHIDHLVVSHDDRDHSGGLADLQALMRIDHVHANHLVAGESCVAGDEWRLGAVTATVVWPLQRQGEGSDNNRSCVIRLAAAGGRVMLMGDLEKEGERALLASGAAVNADLLVVGHHGSGSSSTVQLLQRVAPQLALISRGAYGRWRYPHPAVVARLQRLDIAIADSGRHGALEIRADAKGWTLSRWCDSKPRWYRPCVGVE